MTRTLKHCLTRLGALAFALLISSQALFGLQSGRELSQYSRRVWNTSNDLPQNAVTAILQSSDGYLWLGTQGGLARFDGVAFTIFDAADSAFLADSFITALAESPPGVLWIGTRQGLLRLEDRNFERITEEDGLPHPYVRSLLGDSRGRLWIGTYGGGVAVLESGEEALYRQVEGLSNGFVRALFEDRRGDIWIGTSEGLNRLSSTGLKVFDERSGLSSDFIRAVAEDSDGRLWVGTEGKGLFLLNPETERFRRDLELEGVMSVRALQEDSHGGLWIGSESQGLIRVRDGRRAQLAQADGFPHDSVLSLLEDREGSLWVGTRAGLVQLLDGTVTAYTAREGLGSESVRAIYQDSEGRLWVGTEGAGVQVFQDGRFVDPSLPEEIAAARVRSILQDSGGGLWLGTRIGLLEYRDGRVRRYGTQQGLANDVVNALAEHPAGTLWIGTGGGGISQLRDGVFSTINMESGLSSDRVRVLHASVSGDLWVGTEEGLDRVSASGIRGYRTEDGLTNRFVFSLREDLDGDLWVGTEGGLWLLADDRFTSFVEANALLSVPVFQILEDDLDHLWLSSPRGIFQVEKAALKEWAQTGAGPVRVERFTEADGMLSSECAGGTQPAGWKTRDGKLWFPSLRGVAMIDPANLDRDRAAPQPLIERVASGSREHWSQGPVRFSAGVNTLEVNFTAPSFVAPSHIRFRYKLEGFDPDWIQSGFRRAAFYTNLAPGAYRFLVSASHNGRVWSNPPDSLDLEFAPAFYQTRLFQVLSLLLAAGVVAGFFRYRLRVVEARRQELQQVVEERTDQLRRANQALRELASVDDLTGLTNHRRFQEELQTEWRRAARSQRPLTLIVIDIDFFKRFNDTYGHLAGDACLKAVAHCLSGWVRREAEILARYGGEEFVALLPEISLEEGTRLADEMRCSIEALNIRHEDSSAGPVVTVSAGVASTVPDLERPPSWLFEAADRALYEAKHSGRNRVAVHPPKVG